ncbi:hypothetical protein RBH94_11075 [Aestuariibaculum sp. YM273]|uniref:hypothetical protein n=1 Tax=Aestuariibaculum sp. YM273 TaxID=3070659 RepID=UPI0027DC3AC5|nr:hypothetical protein [Aestuariibaculum sp. YM273]WMI64601.1 hypothetical protein RBH94_11075 [Aestuariibaculum sp. YM273]
MENTTAIKLIDKIVNDLDQTGINTDTLIDDIKKLRGYALEEQIPLVVKVLRLTYEHIEENDTFLIPMPEDEEDEFEVEAAVESSPVDSLKYVISLMRNLDNKINVADLKAYRDALNNF